MDAGNKATGAGSVRVAGSVGAESVRVQVRQRGRVALRVRVVYGGAAAGCLR